MRVLVLILIFVLLVVKDYWVYKTGWKDGVEWACDEFDRAIEEEYGNKDENDIH